MNLSLPPSTQLLISLTVTYRIYFLVFFLAMLGGVAFLFVWSRTAAGGVAVDKLKLKVPFLGDTWIKFQIAQFCRTLSTLLQGGTPLVTALATSADAVSSRLDLDGNSGSLAAGPGRDNPCTRPWQPASSCLRWAWR